MWNRLPRWFDRSKFRSSKTKNISTSVSNTPLLTAAEDAISSVQTLSLDQLRIYWHNGDWDMLLGIEVEQIEKHTDRAKLALLIAVAHEQNRQPEAALEFLKLAKNWGANKREIAQLLISGVHGTLGRARLISGSRQDAIRHFSQSLPAKNLSKIDQLSTDARIIHEAKSLNLPENPFKTGNWLEETFKSEVDRTNIKNLTREFSSEVEKTIKFEMAKAMRQSEAFIGIQSYLIHGQLTPSLHGWPVSPDFGHYLLQTLETQRYDLIIEFGSGTSTILMASVLKNQQKKIDRSENQTLLITFEHLKKYLELTKEALKSFGLTDSTTLVLAELEQKIDESDGQVYDYYQCENTLMTAANTRNVQRILVVVDGPPAATGKHARYPSVPLILKYFPLAELDVLLDDFDRQDEKEIVSKWTKLLKLNSRKFQHKTLDFEKGASHLHVDHVE